MYIPKNSVQYCSLLLTILLLCFNEVKTAETSTNNAESTLTNPLSNNSSTNQSISTEGGEITQVAQVKIKQDSNIDNTHNGREHVTESASEVQQVPDASEVSSVAIKQNKTINGTEPVKPVKEIASEMETPKKNDKTNSVPKKDPKYEPPLISSNVTNSTKTTTTSTTTTTTTSTTTTTTTTTKPQKTSPTTKIRRKKPLFTEPDDEPLPASELEDKNEQLNGHHKIASIDATLLDDSTKSKQSDYLVPIVGVILSVPLVAIIISVVYKRGTDWYQHRNYRRMDFLIEGMYNN